MTCTIPNTEGVGNVCTNAECLKSLAQFCTELCHQNLWHNTVAQFCVAQDCGTIVAQNSVAQFWHDSVAQICGTFLHRNVSPNGCRGSKGFKMNNDSKGCTRIPRNKPLVQNKNRTFFFFDDNNASVVDGNETEPACCWVHKPQRTFF